MFLYVQVFLLLSVTPSQMLIFIVETYPINTVTFPWNSTDQIFIKICMQEWMGQLTKEGEDT